MNNLNHKSSLYKFNDSLIKEIQLDIDSPIKLKSFFEDYHLLNFEIDINVQKKIDESNKKKYIKK
jgi:hypothetical protein